MIALLFIPSLILISLIYGFPIFHYLWLSFHSSSVLTNLVLVPNFGANWVRLLADDRFWMDTFNTFRFASISVSFELVIALLFALILNQEFRRRGLVRSLSLMPWALPTTIMALSWRWIFNTPFGPLEIINSSFNSTQLNILSNPNLAWISTVIADIWKTTPFIALILLAGLQSIPNDLYEAFELEGANKTQILFKVTIPLLRPYILISLLFRVAQAFGVFDLIQVMTGGGPAGTTESIGMYAYLQAMRYLDFGYSSTIILSAFLILIVICLSVLIILNRSNNLTLRS